MMSVLALVPAWWWLTLGIILALAGLMAGVAYSKDRQYRPEHRGSWRRAAHVIEETRLELPPPLPELDRGSMIRDEELAVHHEGWTGPLLAGLHDAGQRPRGMTEPDDLGPGAGFLLSPVTTATCPADAGSVKVDSPAPDELPQREPGSSPAEDGAAAMVDPPSAVAPVLELGPRAQAVLERYEWRRRVRLAAVA